MRFVAMRACLVALAACSAALANAAEIGFVVGQEATEKLTAESRAACSLARRVLGARLLRPAGVGTFVDESGRPVTLGRFAAVWCHQGGGAAPAGPLADPRTVATLRAYAAEGHGLLLSGVAAGLLATLEPGTVKTGPLTFGHDRGQAGLIPAQAHHPVFHGLDLERGVLWMSNAVYPAFARFHAARGTVLARTPGGPENSLVELSLGKGRVVGLAWRLSPHYHIAPSATRANFDGLVANLLSHLASGEPWQPEAADVAGVPPDERRALATAIDDLVATFGERYPRGAEFRKRLKALSEGTKAVEQFRRLRSEALLANPLLDFDRLLLVKRGARNLGLPTNYQSNSSLKPTGYDNEIAVLSPLRPDGRLTTLYRPEGGRFVGDVDLDFDARRLLFSMPADGGRWRIFEMRPDGSALRQLPLIDEPDVDNYDACYLPDGGIIFTSTACFTGVPCVRGSSHVANLYRLDVAGRIRQLTVEQDHDWCPTVLPTGRVLYLRWEYADIPHAFSRILFQMNPDGTGQMEYYGSNSYWPASMFYARPLPGHPTQVVAVVGGHHDQPRMGDLVIFDPAKGRFEADGAVQRIPGRGRKVEPLLLDLPIVQSWPKFLHPYPLSSKHFLVSCKPSAGAPWGIYLADAFDNLVLVREEAGFALLEPIPLRATPRPPVVPDRTDPARRDAEVFLTDVYAGPGLRGVPRGTIKTLRVIGYQFAYQGMGGEPDAMGLDGPWDVRQILGTVPVLADGSAHFRVPACTPVAVQPLDAEGKAVQLMRSWFTAMPGETLSCVGCHESQSSVPPTGLTLAASAPASEIKPWYGPARGFDFRREVQPVLDRHCIGCHSGKADGSAPDLTDRPPVPTLPNKNAYNLAARFTPSYYELRRWVRTPTRESDMHLLPPWEFHADTTRLVQMLRKGHQGVRLDAEGWDRLVTWIDLNAPAHGTWTAICGQGRVKHQWQRRREMRRRYAGMDDDPEAVYPVSYKPGAARPERENGPSSRGRPHAARWPFDAAEARRMQQAMRPIEQTVDLGRGVQLTLIRIPAGEFVMGEPDGEADERPTSLVKIAKPFWMGRVEVTNEQFGLFDPAHDSRLEHGDYIQFSPGERGWSLSRPEQPVVRVSWRAAIAFCAWLSKRAGRPFTLPTEAQWEWACRAGTATPLWYGKLDADFSRFANVSDAAHQAIDRFGWSGRAQVLPPWRPADARFDDGSRVSAPVGTYEPNPWGLCDMHGNVAEWTRSKYRPYPYANTASPRPSAPAARTVVRGGSWYDPPARCRSAFRQSYLPDQGVYDVGFRVVCEEAVPSDP